ncbi:MAG: 3-octaprenyl-4-hydroxybenzoate carboxy-lyase, partial [Deltaproteobacteria bacterium]|nr:3-octaprenyl-4-hydroxybenzoate carboxy-lyase [Deltaproteobacteria bacterium]
MPKRIVIGISGASGVIYGIRMLQRLQDKEFETRLVISEAGRTNIEIETDLKSSDVEGLADRVYDNKNMGAALASGSFLTEGMVVV